MNKNLTIKAGNWPELVRTGAIDPVTVLSKVEPMTQVIEAYKAFDKREPGWLKVELKPAA
jgi:threonine dehydrogenase-like Zn-dependent dehydrogenase